MQKIKVDLKKRSYNIIVGYNILGSLARHLQGLRIGRDAYVITNDRIKNKFAPCLTKALKKNDFSVKFRSVPDEEKSKSMESAAAVVSDLAHFDKRRSVFIIALGGGVVGDLAGFVASIYKRGIAYVQLPTTLLAQVDSAIGGKTAVDLSEGKNLVGAIYQPRLVFSDTSLLNSLDPRQVRSGLAEVIKYGIICDKLLFSYLETRLADILRLEPDAITHIVKSCSVIKAGIVSQDEREEKGLRTILNFGHTVGHAIEAAAGYKEYNHGEAIALGMLVACGISRKLDMLDGESFNRVENLIKAAGLSVKIKKAGLTKIINAHFHDKKFIGKRNRFVLACGIGRVKIVENIPLGIIKRAIKERL